VKAAAVGTYDEILRNFSAKKNAKVFLCMPYFVQTHSFSSLIYK
jgi:hypothetical protein